MGVCGPCCGRHMLMVVRAAALLVGLARYADAQTAHELRVGGLFPIVRSDGLLDNAGVQRLHGALLAISELNDKDDGLYDDVLPDVQIKFTQQDTMRDSAQGFRGAMHHAQRPFDNSGVHAYVGAASSGVTKEISYLSTELGIPQISYSSTAADLSDAGRYPLFMRTPPSDAFQGMAMADVVASFGWDSVATIASDSYYAQAGMRSFSDTAHQLGIAVDIAQSFHERNQDQMMIALRHIKASGSRIIVTFCDSDDAFNLLRQAQLLELAGNSSDVQWITPDSLGSNFIPPQDMDLDALSAILSFLPSRPVTAGTTGFVERFLAQPNLGTMAADAVEPPIVTEECSDVLDDGLGVPLLQISRPDALGLSCVGLNFSTFDSSGANINAYASMAYDAILTLAYGLQSLLGRNGGADRDALLAELDAAGTISNDANGERRTALGQQLYDSMVDVSFEGASGPVRFNPGESMDVGGILQVDWRRGDREGLGGYSIMQYPVASSSLELKEVGNWTAAGGQVLVSNEITWATRDGRRPEPRMCGVDGTLCSRWFGDARPFCDTNTSRCTQAPTHACASTLAVNPTNLTSYVPLQYPDSGWPRGTAASVCEQYLPPKTDVCCRPTDEAATDWLRATHENFDRLFGQCDNCLDNMRRWACQQICDEVNVRFLPLARLDDDASTVEEDGVTGQMCNNYCDTLYLSCKAVEWKDSIEFLYSGSAHDWASVDESVAEVDEQVVDQLGPAETFCTEVLAVDVLPMQCPAASTTACQSMPDPHSDPEVVYFHESRICTPTSGQSEVFCLSSNVHSELGLVSAMLCCALVLAAVICEFLHGLHGRCRDLLPNATVTLILGIILGVLIEFVVAPYEQEHRRTHHASDFAQFNKEIFSFLLLPIIIFSSAFNMDHTGMIFFTLRLRRIMFFAFFGTLIALLFTGGVILFLDGQIGFFRDPISVSEAMMFGSLISAVDPVSTLAAFQSLGVEPRIYAMIYGEAILNDAVAIVAFKVFSTIAEGFSLTGAAYETAYIGMGSVFIGLMVGLAATVLFKYHGSAPEGASKRSFAQVVISCHRKRAAAKLAASQDGKAEDDSTPPSLPTEDVAHGEDEHTATHDAMIFFFASLCCYYISEALHCSGIITALVAGLICNRYAIENLSAQARRHSRSTYTILSEMCDELIMVSIGVSFVTYLRVFPPLFSIIAVVLVVLSRSLSVFPLAALWNAGVRRKASRKRQQVEGTTYSEEEALIPVQHSKMMFAAGLRGAVALALVMGMPSSKVDAFASATLFIIMVTNVVLGGATTNVISALGVHSKQAGNMTQSDTDFTASEEKAVIHWYAFEERWLPFLRLDVDLEERERVLKRRQTKQEITSHDAWRELTLQVVSGNGSARADNNRSPTRESDFDDGTSGAASGNEQSQGPDPDPDPDVSAAEAEARSNAALDLLMPMDGDSTDNPVAQTRIDET